MTDVPVSLTYDNISGIAVADVKAPIQALIADVNDELEKISLELTDLEQKLDKELLAALRKKYKALFNALDKIGDLELESYGTPVSPFTVTVTPTFKGATGSIGYTLTLSKKALASLPVVKQIRELEKLQEAKYQEDSKLRSKLKAIDTASVKVKEELTRTFLNSSEMHYAFKQLIEEKIKKAVE